MLRVLIVLTRLDVGGVPEHVLMLVEHLSRQFAITIACRDVIDEHRARLDRVGVDVKRINFARLPNPLRDASSLLELWRFIRSGRFAVVHSHMSKGALLGGVAARLAGRTAVLTTAHNFGVLALPSVVLRGVFWLYDWLLFHLTLDCLVTVSQRQADAVIQRGLMPRARVRTIWNGVDPGKLHRAAAGGPTRESLSIPPDATVVVTVARLVWFKGIRYLIDAVAQLGASADGVQFLVVGDGDHRDKLQAQIDELGLRHRVTLMGVQMHVPALLALADLFALPSLSEGMPIAIMEAMAFGLPILATAVDGTPELVLDGETGILVPPRDSGAFAAGLRRLLEDHALRRAMGQAGRQRLAETFTEEAMANATGRLYQELAGKVADAVTP